MLHEKNVIWCSSMYKVEQFTKVIMHVVTVCVESMLADTFRINHGIRVILLKKQEGCIWCHPGTV